MDMSNLDVNIIETIRSVRKDFNACTMRAVAGRLHVSVSTVHERISDLTERGLVTVSRMMGSLDVPANVRHTGNVLWIEQPIPLGFGPPAGPANDEAMRFFEALDSQHLVLTHDGPALVGDDVPLPDEIVLSSTEEALRLEALGALVEVPTVVTDDGRIDEALVIQAMAEAASLPTTPEVRQAARNSEMVQRNVARRTRSIKPPRPAKIDLRTPEQIQAAKERMAKVRANRIR